MHVSSLLLAMAPGFVHLGVGGPWSPRSTEATLGSGHQGETHHACMQRAAGHDSSPILRHQPTTSPPRKLCLPLPAGIRTPVRSPSRRLWHARRPACLPAPPRRQRWAPTRAGVNSIQALADECRVQRAAGGPYRPGNSSMWVPYACAPHQFSPSRSFADMI